jgi:hypothetical protein
MMAKRSGAWKAHERAAAELVGGVRVGPSGRATADVVSDWCVVEAKERQALPEWLKDAMTQAEQAAAGFTSPRLPLVVLHEFGGRRVDDLVVMRAGEFRSWFGDWRKEADVDQAVVVKD